ncbi:MAG: transporter substrate-binding domain-containing protein [Clostridia bacterium]
MKIKKILCVITAAAAALMCFTSCSGTKSIEQIKKDGKIVMYTNAEFAPFEYMVGSEVTGVDVDIANEIAASLGVKLDVQNVKFESIITGIKTGKGDFAAAGMTITDERKKSVDFSDEYTTSTQYIITKQGTDISNIKDLAGKKIGVQTGTTGDFLASDEIDGTKDDKGQPVKGALQDTGASVQRFNSALLAAMDLLNGRIDAVIIDKLPATNIVKANSGLATRELTLADGSIKTESYAIAVAKGNKPLLDEINKVIKELKTSGKISDFIINRSNEAAN